MNCNTSITVQYVTSNGKTNSHLSRLNGGIKEEKDPITTSRSYVNVNRYKISNNYNHQDAKQSCKKKKQIYACELCSITFERSYQLKRHEYIGIHTLPVNQVSSNENNSFQQQFRLHLENSLENSESYIYPVRQIITSPTSSTSYTIQYELDCDLCNETFEDVFSLDDHLLVHNKKSANKCELCDESFNYLSILKNHVINHVFCKPFKCEMCEMTFANAILLSRHKNIHFDINNDKFKCTKCGEVFIDQESLSAHWFKHTGIKANKCEQCSCAFIHKLTLQRHYEIAHLYFEEQ